jgi:ribosomal protein L17
MTAFRESQICRPSQCDGFCNSNADRHKKSKKELAKTRLLKLSKTSRIVTTLKKNKNLKKNKPRLQKSMKSVLLV